MNRTAIAERVRTACLLESTARKPGNVHRFADFADASYLDFVSSAIALGETVSAIDLERCGVGALVLESVIAIGRSVDHNTLLGTVLLLAPLVKASNGSPLRIQLRRVLDALSVDDARMVYQAIRKARPAGLGHVGEHDVIEEPTISLLDAMTLAAERDLVARQYANGFAEIFDVAVPALRESLASGALIEAATIRLHLILMSTYPDSLIERRCGMVVAQESARRATAVLQAGLHAPIEAKSRLHELDQWLRGDGHRRNPGTTADLVAATLYVALYDGVITTPIDWRRQFPPHLL